jgi:hypothetical protein
MEQPRGSEDAFPTFVTLPETSSRTPQVEAERPLPHVVQKVLGRISSGGLELEAVSEFNSGI